jgi:hypothetical protein
MGFKKHCVDMVMDAIEDPVLELAFYNREMNDSMMSMEQKILSRALEPRFFLDLNIIGGIEVDILLSDCIIVSTTDTSTLIRIPDTVMGGRKLINVLNISTALDYESITGSSLESVAQQSFEKEIGMNSYVTTRIEKVSDNEFLVGEIITDMYSTRVKCLMTYSNDFVEISSTFWPSLSLTAIEAAKLYIYRTLNIKVNQTALYNGYELTAIRSIIDDYRDSFTRYMELIDGKTKKQTFAADRVKMRKYTMMTFGKYS